MWGRSITVSSCRRLVKFPNFLKCETQSTIQKRKDDYYNYGPEYTFHILIPLKIIPIEHHCYHRTKKYRPLRKLICKAKSSTSSMA